MRLRRRFHTLTGMDRFALGHMAARMRSAERRCVLVLLCSMATALVAGLLAWGPVVLTDNAHRYADQREFAGIPNALDVLSNLPLIAAGAWGWTATRVSRWSALMRRVWRRFFTSIATLGIASLLYHAAPGDFGFALTQLCVAASFSLLLLCFLAERVNARFAGLQACFIACAASMLAAALWWFDAPSPGSGDLRGLLLLQTLPVLLVPAGALALCGRQTTMCDWIAMLCLYGIGRLCGLADTAVLQTTGAVGGHALMHLACAGVAAWPAWRCTQAPRIQRAPEVTHRSTSS
jgi:hypothetical protein